MLKFFSVVPIYKLKEREVMVKKGVMKGVEPVKRQSYRKRFSTMT